MSEYSVNPWQPTNNPLTLAVLGKLAEELGELSQITGRCIIQGVREKEPTTGKVNREALKEEIADVLACMYLAGEHLGMLDQGNFCQAIHDRVKIKVAHLRSWHTLIEGAKDV